MRSIKKRNILFRSIVVFSISLVVFIVSIIIPQTSAHEEKTFKQTEEFRALEQFITTETYEIQQGDTLLAIFQIQVGISYGDVLLLIEKINEVFDITKIKQGNVVTITLVDGVFDYLSYDINSKEELIISKQDLEYIVERKDIIFEIKESVVEGDVGSSFYTSGIEVGLTDRMIMELATVFAWDVDFTSSLQKGDEFSLVFQNKYREGKFAGTGDLLAGRFVNDGQEFFTYLVKDKEGNNKYYNEDGDATERLLLKTPINYKRISSGFSLNRKHPILGTFKNHKAIDFAADTGTPVETVGDGEVVFAGWSDTYGNYIKIEHGQGFVTAYAHLSKMYVSPGSRVKQGSLIGAVGTTGRSTGPHLHYEMYKNGSLVNPLTTKTPAGKSINEALKSDLLEIVSRYKAQL